MAGGPFSEYEQRFLLSEVLKASTVPVEDIVDFLREQKVEPSWRVVGLPGGRNLDDCENTFDHLINNGELPPHNPNAPYTPGTSQPYKRVASGPLYSSSAARAIKPKPLHSVNGTPSAPYSGKKRGRPSKADLERRAQEAAAAAAGDDGDPMIINADGQVSTGQKRKMGEGEDEDASVLAVQQAQGALAMPAAMMQGSDGQPTPKRGRGRPRKIRPEEQTPEHSHQLQPVEQQLPNQEKQDSAELEQEQDAAADETVLLNTEEALQQQIGQNGQLEVEQESHIEGPAPEEDSQAMHFFQNLQRTPGGVSHGHQ